MTAIRVYSALLISTIGSMLAAGCADPTVAPDVAGTQQSPVHTTVVGRVSLSGGPLGIAVSTRDGIAYVTRDQVGSVARLERFATAFSDNIPVGAVPSYITFNPAGTKAYVANQFSDNIGVIDVATNTQTDVIPVTGDPLPVAITADGNTLFTTTNANQLYKINLATGQVVGSLPLPATSHHLLVSGATVYVATRDAGSVLEVNGETMVVTRRFILGGRTQGMAIAPNGQELYVANEISNVLHVVRLSSGTVVATVPLAGGGEGLALSPNGQQLYVGLVFSGAVQVVDRGTRTVVQTIFTGGRPREIGVDPAQQRILVANEAGWVDMFGVAEGPPDNSSVAHIPLSGGPLGIAVSTRDGIAYVTRDQVGSVARLERFATAFSDNIPVGAVPSYITFNPAGTKAYVANQFSDNIGVIDVATNTQTDVIPVTGDPLPVAITADGNTLFTTTNANQLYKIDLATRQVVGSLPLPATSHHLLVSGATVYVATRDAGSVLEVNGETMVVTRRFILGGRTQGMAIAPNGQELYVANEVSNVLHVVSLSSGTVVATVPLAGGGEGLALSPNGQQLYVGLVFSGAVQVVDRGTRTVVQSIFTGGTPREIGVDPAQQRILVANEAGWVDIITLH